jgi:hypothetical protein
MTELGFHISKSNTYIAVVLAKAKRVSSKFRILWGLQRNTLAQNQKDGELPESQTVFYYFILEDSIL